MAADDFSTFTAGDDKQSRSANLLGVFFEPFRFRNLAQNRFSDSSAIVPSPPRRLVGVQRSAEVLDIHDG